MADFAQRGVLPGLRAHWGAAMRASVAAASDQVRESPHAEDCSASCGSWASSSWELVGASCASFGDPVELASSAPWELDGASSLGSGGELAPADAPGEPTSPKNVEADTEMASAAMRAPPFEWYPCGSMELDAVAAQEVMMRAEAERASTCGSGASTPGRQSRCSGGSSLADVAMSLESFLEEEVPAFPFSKGTRGQ